MAEPPSKRQRDKSDGPTAIPRVYPLNPTVYSYPLSNPDAKHVQTWVHEGRVYVAEH